MWSYCPSFTTIKLRFDNSKLVEFQTIEKVVSDEMNKNQNFKFMLDLVFFKDYDTLKKVKRKLIVCGKRKDRDITHLEKWKFLCLMGGILMELIKQVQLGNSMNLANGN